MINEQNPQSRADVARLLKDGEVLWFDGWMFSATDRRPRAVLIRKDEENLRKAYTWPRDLLDDLGRMCGGRWDEVAYFEVTA